MGDNTYLGHILDAITAIDNYVFGLTFEKFANSAECAMARDAVVRQFEIIGEATRNLSASFKKNNDSIPWRNIAGTRNNLIHEYFGVDYEIVWSAIKDDLPPLKKFLADKVNPKLL